MSYFDPYHRLGLHRNPFIAPDILEIPPQLWLDFGFSQPPPTQKRLFWQVIGEKGAGKTSHLLHWQRHTGGTYYYCQPGWKKYSLPPVNAIAYWDEANRIPLPLLITSLWRSRCLNATIVVATHDDLSKIANLCGFKVKSITLNTLCTDNLLEWAKKLIKAERLSPSIPINLVLTAELAQKIVLKSQNSWRKAANYLHIWAAEIAICQQKTPNP